MNERIDHAQLAESLTGTSWWDATAIPALLEAVTHATLALVEQQRIANVLAAAHLPGDVFDHEKMLNIKEGLGL